MKRHNKKKKQFPLYWGAESTEEILPIYADFRYPQTPGLGGINELTTSEEVFIQNIVGLSYSTGDVIYYDGSNLTNLGIGSEGQVLKVSSGGIPEWGTDATGSGGSAITLDLGDDGGNDSTDLTEIAITGDTNSIFTEPSVDKLLIAVGNNWPTADAATTLTGLTATVTELNILDGVTATASELNILDGATLTVTELNYVDGVTSAIQTQIDAKAPSTSPTFDGNVFINDTSNANMGVGLTINQGANDDQILAFKSSDIGTGLSTALVPAVETDDFGIFSKADPLRGGLLIRALAEDGAVQSPLQISVLGGTAATTKTTSGVGSIALSVFEHDGANGFANVVADGNLMSLAGRSGGGTPTRFIWDIEGSAHADVEWTTYDTYDDLNLIANMESELLLREDEAKTERRHMLEQTRIIGKGSWHMEDGKPRAMVDFSRLSMLHHGALIQVAERFKMMEIELAETKRQLAALSSGN